mmetsp:Transcript_57140/g.107759  ORF Transcript_57140/g.107759 Transcript_57140/m.107759 type:complete len:296 (+) Transcript_57140:140-1027(+)
MHGVLALSMMSMVRHACMVASTMPRAKAMRRSAAMTAVAVARTVASIGFSLSLALSTLLGLRPRCFRVCFSRGGRAVHRVVPAMSVMTCATVAHLKLSSELSSTRLRPPLGKRSPCMRLDLYYRALQALVFLFLLLPHALLPLHAQRQAAHARLFATLDGLDLRGSPRHLSVHFHEKLADEDDLYNPLREHSAPPSLDSLRSHVLVLFKERNVVDGLMQEEHLILEGDSAVSKLLFCPLSQKVWQEKPADEKRTYHALNCSGSLVLFSSLFPSCLTPQAALMLALFELLPLISIV